MNDLQAELDADHPELDIQIVGINEFGQESANALMTEGRATPWLQDVDGDNDLHSDIWTEWNVTYRDVVIVDRENTELGAFNLTTYNLADANTYAALREILIDTAADQPFWQNRDNHLDVNKDGIISAQGDVLPGINELNNHFLTDDAGKLPALRLPPMTDEPYIDVSGDGVTTAQADLLPIINFLNNAGSGEGEFVTGAQWNVSAAGEAETPLAWQLGSTSAVASALPVVPADSPPILSIPNGSVAVALASAGRSEDFSVSFVASSPVAPSPVAPSPVDGVLADESSTGDSPDFLATSLDDAHGLVNPAPDDAWRLDSVAAGLIEDIDNLDDLAADVAVALSSRPR